MRTPLSLRPLKALLLIFTISLVTAGAQTPVPDDEIKALQTALQDHKKATSPARQRLAIKRINRDAASLLTANPKAPNRFEVLGLLFTAQQTLFALDQSPRNREALLETSSALAKAPDSYATLRLDADLLLTQTELARQGSNAETRVDALRPLVKRYRDTKAEAKMLRIALVMALELGDSQLIRELRKDMAERFAGDLDLIIFQRDRLGGQVFGAPFCGTFKRSDGSTAHYPSDALGKSTGLYFWSKEDGGLEDLKRLAESWKAKKDDVSSRLNIISINLDELPDAGQKTLNEHGLTWAALHLPGGKKSNYYKAFARRSPALVTLSPTGYAAFTMAGVTRKSSGNSSLSIDYERWIASTLARAWTKPRYVDQFTSITTGDFLITEPTGPFDPTLPPELRGQFPESAATTVRLQRTDESVPEEALEAIQKCFVSPPLRYRLPLEEIIANYRKAEKLCAEAIASHPNAPDLWIVHNRRIIAQMGLWRLTSDLVHFKNAVKSSNTALKTVIPNGADLIARFCLARQALREPGNSSNSVISDFVRSRPSNTTLGPSLAAAALLSLDAGNQGLHENYRRLILNDHIGHSMMWNFTSFLLNRYHRYQIFRAPYNSGRTFGRRQAYFLGRGTPGEATRSLDLTLPTIEGKDLEISNREDGKSTLVIIRNDHTPVIKNASPGLLRNIDKFAQTRPLKDFETVVLITTSDLETSHAIFRKTPLAYPTAFLSGGSNNPLLQRLGVLSEDEIENLMIVRPDGSVGLFVSGLSIQAKGRDQLIRSYFEMQDEQRVIKAIEGGDLTKAKEIAHTFLPPPDPEADKVQWDPRRPENGLPHLRARARLNLALGDLKAALEDADWVVKRQTEIDAAMSFKTDQLDEAEAFRSIVRKRIEEGNK